MRRSTARKLLRARRREFLHHAGTLVRHASYLFDRSSEAPELTLQVVNRGFESIAQHAPAIGKEEIAGGSADYGAEDRPSCHSHSVVHNPSRLGLSKTDAREGLRGKG
jgi:hypothetical protein